MPRNNIVGIDSGAYAGRQSEIASRQETTPTGGRKVTGHEVAPWYAVLVGEYQVVGSRSLKSAVQYHCFTETIVGMPYMPYRKDPGKTLHKCPSLRTRTVVGNNYLVGPASLRHITCERFFEPARIVVCGNNHSYGFGRIVVHCL